MLKVKTDLLSGSILKSIIIFALPMFLANIFQQLYSTADMMIVGNFLEDGGRILAAIGAGAVVFEMMLSFAMGVGAGFGIVVSRAHGAGDMALLRKAVAGSAILGGALVLIISVGSSFWLRPLLYLLDTPADIIDDAYTYTSILLAFVFVLFLNNLCGGLLRAIGNSLIPLLFLIFSSVLNIGMNFLFILGFGMGIRGVAFATVIVQAVSAALCLFYIKRYCPELVPKRKDFRPDVKLYKDLATQGLSMGLMLAIVSAGTVFLQSAINSLEEEWGYLIITAHVAARRIGGFCMMPVTSIAVSLSTFVAQNKGANQPKRILKAIRYANLMSIGWGIIITPTLFFISTFLVTALSGSSDPIVIENGTQYLIFHGPFYMVLGWLMNYRLSLQAMGQKITPIISSVIEFIGKIIFAIIAVPALGYFGVILCEPLIWCAMTIQLFLSYQLNPYVRKARRRIA